jgi:site-specific DNA recombinase
MNEASRARRDVAAAVARRALAYLRVSSEDQIEGVSLAAQEERIRGYAIAKGLELDAVVRDEGASGKTLERPGMRKIIARCETGTVGAVIVMKLDRLTRRTRDLLHLVEDLFLARGVELHSVSESLDTSTPHGRFVLTLLGSLAQLERETIVARTRGALAWKREHGQPTSHAPLGFRSAGKRKPMLPVPAELRVVRRIFDLWERGGTYLGISRNLNAEHVRTKRGGRWYAATVRQIIQHRDLYARVLKGL